MKKPAWMLGFLVLATSSALVSSCSSKPVNPAQPATQQEQREAPVTATNADLGASSSGRGR